MYRAYFLTRLHDCFFLTFISEGNELHSLFLEFFLLRINVRIIVEMYMRTEVLQCLYTWRIARFIVKISLRRYWCNFTCKVINVSKRVAWFVQVINGFATLEMISIYWWVSHLVWLNILTIHAPWCAILIHVIRKIKYKKPLQFGNWSSCL